MEKVGKYKVGDVLSESSHYTIVGFNSDGSFRVKHHESGDIVNIGATYVDNYIKSADLYDEEIEVTKEDKKDGTPGIRTIWENIHSSQVFTVCFKKQDKPKSHKRLNQEIEGLSMILVEEIDRVKAQKKGVANAAKKFITGLIKNPILPYEKGEERVLRGYKIQFESRDGRYNCVDMDIIKTEKEDGIRPVNINEIRWIIYNGVKYVVK